MMRTRRTMLSVVGLLAVVVAATAFAAPQDKDKAKKAKVGEPAPAFTLTDAEGKSYNLADYKGKIVVLQWINSDCPVCVRVTKSGLLAKMRDDLKKIDPSIIHLGINSTNYQEVTTGAKYWTQHKIDAPVLNDLDGTVGHMYGARTTPHMYVIDKEGVLRYDGAFDNDARGGKDDATNYVVNAVRQIVDGETVTPDTTRPYGCSVKYKK